MLNSPHEALLALTVADPSASEVHLTGLQRAESHGEREAGPAPQREADEGLDPASIRCWARRMTSGDTVESLVEQIGHRDVGLE